MSGQATVLVVDDEVRSLESLKRVLCDEFEVICAREAGEARRVLESEIVHAILCDQRMQHETGVDFLKHVRETWPDPVRMIISGYSDSDDIIAGINEAGIYQYIAKPWHPDRLLETVRGAIQLFRLQKETETAGIEIKLTPERAHHVATEKRRAARRLYEFDRIVHAPDSPLRNVIELGKRAAEFDISVLITGESGTGKELLARAIHYGSARSGKAFVVENCGALPDELLESELFGCKKGAFTGAYQDRVGLFEVADGGSIFLDEIGETSPAFQVKLLRVLQESEIRPLGAQRVRKVDVRVIAATNRDLEAEVRAGRFRRDLYYRLAAFPLHMPALRERPMDIELIAAKVLADVAKSYGRAIHGIAPLALERMRHYDWPGNVRELQNEIQRMVVLTNDGWLHEQDLSARIRQGSVQGSEPIRLKSASRRADATLKTNIEALERHMILDALDRHGGNISRVAGELGLSRVGLRNKLGRYDLRKDLGDEA